MFEVGIHRCRERTDHQAARHLIPRNSQRSSASRILAVEQEMMNPGAILVLAASVVAAAPQPSHSIDFWRQLVKNKYTIAPGSDVAALTTELLEMLASPDPERRDEIAYSTLATWIYQTRAID